MSDTVVFVTSTLPSDAGLGAGNALLESFGEGPSDVFSMAMAGGAGTLALAAAGALPARHQVLQVGTAEGHVKATLSESGLYVHPREGREGLEQEAHALLRRLAPQPTLPMHHQSPLERVAALDVLPVPRRHAYACFGLQPPLPQVVLALGDDLVRVRERPGAEDLQYGLELPVERPQPLADQPQAAQDPR